MIAETWTLYFHYTIPAKEGTESLDLYTLRRQIAVLPYFTIAVPHGNKYLLTMLEEALNGLPENTLKEEYEAIMKKIFHGPWHTNDLIGVKYLHITDTEERQIKRIIFKEGAERIMMEARYENLKKEHSRLQKAHEVQGNQLLRAQAAANHNYAEKLLTDAREIRTVTDLFESNITMPQLAIPEPVDTACRKDTVQNRR